MSSRRPDRARRPRRDVGVRAAVLAPVLAAVALVSAAVPATAAPAAPLPPEPPTAAVALGDSYISGEAGRWEGNSVDRRGDRAGTDRAFVPTWWGGYHDARRVYGDSADNGCHRSDVAPVHSAGLPVDVTVNLACSGAATRNVLSSGAGGAGLKGESPQGDQLAAVAVDHDVELVVVSVGGNDLGFAEILVACSAAYLLDSAGCRDLQQALVDRRLPAVAADVARTLVDVRAVLDAAGQPPASYRLVLQSYPSPIPRAAENRYPERSQDRARVGGCPFGDRDSDWARDHLVPQIADVLRQVAADAGAQFLDLRDALQGREVCATGTAVSDGSPVDIEAEWVRYLRPASFQGRLQEAMHPNAFGQRAFGSCLGLLWEAGGDGACLPTPGAGTAGMRLEPLP